ncbi:MAG: endopeptidase La [Deltaproteobacteria bacterium]|nr:endopeptidase La [Deltaproteobacteria bacterium]MBW2534266.1 endopeptidase La [Deltaproteobacteria bacterium]
MSKSEEPGVEVVSPESEPPASLAKLDEEEPRNLFIYTVHGVVLYPGMMFPLPMPSGPFAGILEQVESQKGFLGVLFGRSENGDKAPPPPEGLTEVGTLAKYVRRVQTQSGGEVLLFQLTKRFRVGAWVRTEPFLVARVDYPTDVLANQEEIQGLWRACQREVAEILELNPSFPEELKVAVANIDGPVLFADFVAANFKLELEERIEVLQSFDVRHRLEVVLRALHREHDLWQLGEKIQNEIRQTMEKKQKEFFLREQLKAIRRELGEEVDEKSLEVEGYEKKIEELKMNPEAEKAAREQLKRFAVLPPEAAETAVVRTYLDWLTDLPWSTYTEDNEDIVRAERILERDHYGLDEVKERIVEHLAVRKLKADLKGSILCLSGPPGVGKTSLGRSVAEALGRQFYRFSLGGMRDEAEIKGHRRTYVGALPGKLIRVIKEAGSSNPVLMLDEIDKLGKDFRGDPSSALLEVLDPEQNHAFVDHYLDVPYDLSRVIFIATANVKASIPPPLLDRMEVIEIPGYIPTEKVEIAARHLVPKQLEHNGLRKAQLKISKPALRSVVLSYTREAGVRNLEREIGKICRKVAAQVARGAARKVSVSAKNLSDFLGPAQFESDLVSRTQRPGVAVGLAWTPFGGDVLFIEATRMKGRGSLRVTGQLGDVMKESTQIALSYVRAHAAELRISPDAFESAEIHIHFPAGAVPKDGPSAGVTIATTLVSLLSRGGKGKPVKARVAMTGELTLRGNVLPVGGIREKIVAAKRSGVKTVIIPKRNEKDLTEVPDYVQKGMTIHLAETFDDVLARAF